MKNNNVIWNKDIKSFYFNFLNDNLNDFRFIVLNNFSIGVTYSILVRVEYNKGLYGMLGPQIGFRLDNVENTSSIDMIYKNIIRRIEWFSDFYKVDSIDSIQVLFVQVNVLPKLLIKNINSVNLPSEVNNVKDVRFKYNSKFLPLTTDTNYFGKVILGDKQLEYLNKINLQLTLLGKNPISNFDQMYLYQNYIVLSSKISDNVFQRELYDFDMGIFEGTLVDTVLDRNAFERKYNNIAFTISDSEVSLVTVHKQLSLIKYQGHKSDKLVSNPYIGTFDLETFEDFDGVAKVYAAGFCVSKQEPVMFYLNNLNDNILLQCIDSMLVPKYEGYIFYIHNLNFDGVFLIHQLKSYNLSQGYEHYKIDTIYKDSSLLKLQISVARVLKDKSQNVIGARREPRDIKITFVDSSNILKGSLRRLCKAFNIESSKGYFPYKFVSTDTLNYVGITPSFNYWNDLTINEYNLLVKENWSLKEECLSYLSRDLSSLLEIIILFNQYVTRKFDVNMTECLTISRLSLNIYLKNYLKDKKIPIIIGNMYDDIKNAYYGGVTEVYKPYGKDLYYYDVNSLYPYVALNFMCGNDYTYLECYKGSLLLNDLFGFFYCEIEASDNYLGLLPYRTVEGLIMPIGKWSGWYFSEELKFAESNGYKIKVIKGYSFNKENYVFSDYVNYLYNIKSTTNNDVEKAVSKSLLNNLLGRFGLNINKATTEIVDKNQLDYLLSTRECNSFKKITDNDYLISYYPKVSKSICETHNCDYLEVLKDSNTKVDKNSEFKDVSLVISAAITSYARIHMARIKLDILDKGNNIYYTDTDSIVTDAPLDPGLVGKNLGQFKLEHTIKEGYFISNKTYALLLHNDKTVIRNKGLHENALTLDDFKDLYKGINVRGLKRHAVTDWFKGSVLIKDDKILINHNSYRKRTKIFEHNKWIDTKPLNINEIQKISVKSKKKILSEYLKYHIPLVMKLTRLLGNLFLVLLSFMLVALIGDTFDLGERNNISSNTYSKTNVIKPNQYGILNKNYFVNNSFILRNHIQYTNDDKLNKILDKLLHSITDHNIRNNSKFPNKHTLITYAMNHIDNEINTKSIKLSVSEYFNIINSLRNTINNHETYNYLISKSVRIKSPVTTPIDYNIQSDGWLFRYSRFVNNPNAEVCPYPGDMVVRNKISLKEELDKANENYTYLVDCLDSIIKDINVNLDNKPRSIKSS